MKLYYNILRSGTDVQTFRKPPIVVRPELPVELAGTVDVQRFIELLSEAAPFLKRSEAVEMVQFLIRYAYFTLHLTAIGINVWMEQQVFITALWLKIGWVAGPAMVFGFAILVILLLGKVTEYPEQLEWGHRWTMRFEQRIWDAEFYEIDHAGRYWFRRGVEYGDVLIAERRNHHFLGQTGDVWDYEWQWIEQKKVGLIWHNYSWSKSVMGWVGLCDRWTEDLYVLQEPFYGNLP